MAQFDLRAVPEQHRETVESALATTFGASGVSSVLASPGGASGALTYRVETRTGDHLLRIETIRGSLRNPYQYECMQTAAEAGIAPPIRYVDAGAGVVIMPFVSQRPLTDFPGGPPAVASAVAALLARLHRTPTFPAHGDYMDNLARMLAYLERSGRVAPGLLDQHAAGFERIRAAYPWSPDSFVSAHNDPNQFNMLYDGDRLWLIDWETASRNDAFIDLATVSGYLAPTADLRDDVLRSGLGREPDPLARARLALMGWLTQLYAGCILLVVVIDPDTATHAERSGVRRPSVPRDGMAARMARATAARHTKTPSATSSGL